MAVRFPGLPQGVSSWSVSEDAVSLDRADASAGIPAVSVSGFGANPLGLGGKPFTVVSDLYGDLLGEVVDMTMGPSAWGIVGSVPLIKMNQIGSVPPRTNLRADQAVRLFFEAVGLRPSDYKLEVQGLESRTFTVAAGHDHVWSMFRQWLSANELDLSYTIDTLYVRPQRTEVLFAGDLSADFSAKIEENSKAVRVDVNVYHRRPFTRAQVWPPVAALYPGADDQFGDQEFHAMSVGAGEVVEAEIHLNAEVSSLRVPTQVQSIPVQNGVLQLNPAQYPNGVYMIVGKDNKRIMPSQWRDMGGGLSLQLHPDKKTVTVRLTGMNYEPLAPYRLCESDGEKDYPGLYIMADNGSFVDIETLRFSTGATGTEEVRTIDNPNIVNRTQAYHAAQHTADLVTGHMATLSWSGSEPVRSGFKDRIRQAFGRIAGARMYLIKHWWRIVNAQYSESGVALTAERDVTLGDIQRVYPSPRFVQPDGASLRELADEGIL